jgi:hypothetical protein
MAEHQISDPAESSNDTAVVLFQLLQCLIYDWSVLLLLLCF